VISEIQSKNPSVSVKFVSLDLSSQASVRAAATTINSLVEKIDILINNGAIMVCPYSTSVDGIELQFATNYLGHFLLTNLLIEKVLKAGPGARVVNVSSSAHRSGVIRFDDVNFEVSSPVQGQMRRKSLQSSRMVRCTTNGKRTVNPSPPISSSPMP
jgi:NAD(P)-dependent dehydrogenase (short-subunit alcohol dehydrogenase family)